MPVTRLKFHTTVIAGQSPASEDVTDQGVLPFIQGCAEFGSRNPIPVKYCDSAPKRAPSGSTLVSVRAPVGELNVAAEDIGIGRGVAAIVAHQSLSPRFTVWLLDALIPALQTLAAGSTFDAVAASDIGNLKFELPSLPDQTRIAHFLDEQTAKIDDLRSHCREHVALLREYRASLISAAVTGQLDIANFGRNVA